MSRTIVIRTAARIDLAQIWRYTSEVWDRAQADKYVVRLSDDFTRLAEAPGLGSDRSEVRPGLRKLNSGRHAIYYYHDDSSLRISRVLHLSMHVDDEGLDDQ